MDRRGLLKLGAAGAAASVVASTAAFADVEVQVNRRHRVRVGDVQILRKVFFDDPQGNGWLEIATSRGDCHSEMICRPDKQCPIDPRELCTRLEQLTGLVAQDCSWKNYSSPSYNEGGYA